jgi:hypothetical protein
LTWYDRSRYLKVYIASIFQHLLVPKPPTYELATELLHQFASFVWGYEGRRPDSATLTLPRARGGLGSVHPWIKAHSAWTKPLMRFHIADTDSEAEKPMWFGLMKYFCALSMTQLAPNSARSFSLKTWSPPSFVKIPISTVRTVRKRDPQFSWRAGRSCVVYSHLLLDLDTPPPGPMVRWTYHDWPLIWSQLMHNEIAERSRMRSYRILHDLLPLTNFSDASASVMACPFCKFTIPSDLTGHVFAQCPTLSYVYHSVASFLSAMGIYVPVTAEFIRFNGANQTSKLEEPKRRTVRALCVALKDSIYMARNALIHNQISLNPVRVLNQISENLTNQITADMLLFKKKERWSSYVRWSSSGEPVVHFN